MVGRIDGAVPAHAQVADHTLRLQFGQQLTQRVTERNAWLAGLETYAFPRLGKETTGSITAADIIATLSPIWQTIPDTARQVRNRICVVLDYAHAKGWRSSEAPSGNGSLKAGRGLPRQVKERVNRKAMPYVAVPAYISALQRKPSYGRLALWRSPTRLP